MVITIRLPAVQCVPCKLVNSGPDELRGTYLLDMVIALFVFVLVTCLNLPSPLGHCICISTSRLTRVKGLS